MKNLPLKYRPIWVAIPLMGSFLFSFSKIRAEDGFPVPEGFVTWTAAAGTGTAKKVTALSVPLYAPGQATGRMNGEISSVTANTVSDLSANWAAGQLSVPSSPYLLKITSGAATGRTFLISTSSSNTGNKVTIDSRDAAQADLVTLGIVTGDRYEIFECDTLASLFGTPATTGIKGGTSSTNADSLLISNNGQLETYFFSTALNRWTKVVLGNPDATSTPIRPDTGILYSRLANTDWVVKISGRVAATDRVAAVKNSGTTILSQNWPLAVPLLDTKIHQIPNWTANISAASADKVRIVADGTTFTYWFDGTHWRKQVSGSPIADMESIPAGSAVTLEQLGSQSGYSTLSQPLPYSLE